jgi:BMFP domain-containing protein YqiC
MIKPDSNMIDDVARLAGGAVGIANDIRQSIAGDIKERVEHAAANLDLIPRDEFERLELLVKTQADRIDALETELTTLKKTK